MIAWAGKYVIGLTGNIATGKSVVRKMLEHLGAYGIDADALGHRAIARGAPGYQPVIDTFGRWILSRDGQIERSRLARIVFNDPEALAHLEAIVHPLVRDAIDLLVRRSVQPVVVIEAIKLLEGPLREACDSVWVTYAPVEIQLQRLMQKRGMSEEAARLRIIAQPPQELKLAAADVIIHNDSSFDRTWDQVIDAWEKMSPPAKRVEPKISPVGEPVVERARPQQAEEIATFITWTSQGSRRLTREDIMASFGEKAFLLLKNGEDIVGLVGWQVENLVARTDDIYLKSDMPVHVAMPALLGEVERASRELQCEASLLFLPPNLAGYKDLWSSLGYEFQKLEGLSVRAWQEAAVESMPSGSVLLFKQLRKDRVLQPI